MSFEEEELERIKTMMCEIPQFDNLAPAEIDILSRLVIRRKINKGSVLTKEGSAGDTLFYILDGMIEVEKESLDGKHKALAQFGKGATLGEMGLIDNAPRSATSTAISDLEILSLSRDNFEKLVTDHPRTGVKILKNIARSLAVRLRFTSGRFADVFR